MNSISLDLETFSSISLSKSGVYKYCESDDFEILLFGYSIDGGKAQVVDLASGEKVPAEIINALTDDRVEKWAFNAQFERICLSSYIGMPTGNYLNPQGWHCTMVWSATLGLPLSLEGVGAVLGLEKQKLNEGKNLIRYFCIPCSTTKINGGRTRNLPEHDIEKWIQFKSYNLSDVEVELAIQQKLSKFPVSDAIWDEYHLDQEINDRGIGVDMTFVKQAIAIDDFSRDKLTLLMQKITNIDNPNSVQQMKGWLADNGLETDTLDKKAVVELLKTAPDPLREVLELRQQLAKSSVKKYTAMQNAVCKDSRARGMFQFYGANRTGRFSGRLIQLQNLPQNHMPDLEQARGLVRSGNFDALTMLYDSIPEVLSELIRTAFVPQGDKRFIVADFSAIEARVIAWLAGEQWRLDVFADGGDIYCSSASQMFRVPVEKNGINGHLRQKGKVAELACISEGSLVLTDKGLVPIENITFRHRLWDGHKWVNHDGVIYNGEREVIEYEGLRATPDHPVWIKGSQEPIQFGIAASCGAHLVQTGNGREPIRLGESNKPRKKMECSLESLLCINPMSRLWGCWMAEPIKLENWKVKGLFRMFSTTSNTVLALPSADSCKTKVRKPQNKKLQSLWSQRHQIQLPFSTQCGSMDTRECGECLPRFRDGQDRQLRKLRSGKYSVCSKKCKPSEQKNISNSRLQTRKLAICKKCCYPNVIKWDDKRENNRNGRISNKGKEKKLEANSGKVRVYDILDAGKNNRFTVSNVLVHNCGYGGSVGALKAMGALEMGIPENELQGLINNWRESNPNITKLWWDVDRAVKGCIKNRIPNEIYGIGFSCKSGMLFITLPSGRRLCYAKPCIGVNVFGGESVTYEGVGATKKWERLESYGPKFVENIVQAISRDILCYAMKTLCNCRIVAHVHDEIIIETDKSISLDTVCTNMGKTPIWAKGLILRADGYECEFYQKD